MNSSMNPRARSGASARSVRATGPCSVVVTASVKCSMRRCRIGGWSPIALDLWSGRPTLVVMTDASWRSPDPAAVERALGVLGDRRWLVLTGAGVSTDSGIPDYRGPGAAVRTPMTYQQFVAGPDSLQRYWARAHLGWSRMGGAEPNATHHRLVELESEGQLSGLITQNVDGLHRRAGHRDLVELHGRVDRVVCLDCGDRTSRSRLQRRLSELNPG